MSDYCKNCIFNKYLESSDSPLGSLYCGFSGFYTSDDFTKCQLKETQSLFDFDYE